MSDGPDVVRRLDRAAVDDCWNRIGVHGDRSCPELKQWVHCRNCPVYAAGAADLLNGDVPDGYLTDGTAHFARPRPPQDAGTRAIVIFRIAAEWLALSASVVTEIANVLPIHSLPHRQDGAVLGVASVRGELIVCVSLGQIVGVEQPLVASAGRRGTSYPRVLVIQREGLRAVCPVDEVYGLHRFHPRELKEVPTTVAKAPITHSTALLTWRDRAVGILDDPLLFYSLRRRLG